MITESTYKGHFTYDNQNIQKAIGNSRTNFVIEVEEVIGNFFRGIINDDKATGGVEGTGTVHGQVEDKQVWFTKEMPNCFAIKPDGGKMKLSGKHPTIYYNGTANADFTKITGVWKMKFTIKFVGFMPLPIMPSTGTFEMNYNENTF